MYLPGSHCLVRAFRVAALSGGPRRSHLIASADAWGWCGAGLRSASALYERSLRRPSWRLPRRKWRRQRANDRKFAAPVTDRNSRPELTLADQRHVHEHCATQQNAAAHGRSGSIRSIALVLRGVCLTPIVLQNSGGFLGRMGNGHRSTESRLKRRLNESFATQGWQVDCRAPVATQRLAPCLLDNQPARFGYGTRGSIRPSPRDSSSLRYRRLPRSS
jgi:hypothetical protein